MSQDASYEGLARKYRPQVFEDLVGQETVGQALQSALRQGRLSHGHIFAGPRGVGKTTSARILAKALNCEQGPTPTPCGRCRHCTEITAGNHLDVIEIDAASNTGVDNIRDLRERVIQSPFTGRYKIYIIDEVHMLSNAAFNALLKTLEEPPPNVIFAFATTELDKVPETIRSRCAVHAFRRLGAEDIVRRLRQVAELEGVELGEEQGREIFDLIAQSVEGGMRDALVIFDQLLSITDGQPTAEAALKLLGLAERSTLTRATRMLVDRDPAGLLALIEDLVERGRNLERFAKSLTAYLRDVMLLQAGADDHLTRLTGEPLEQARAQADAIPPATLFNILNQLFELEQRLKRSTQARFLVEFTFLRIASVQPVVPIDDLMRRIRALPETTPAAPASAASDPAPSKSKPARRSASPPRKPHPAPALRDPTAQTASPPAPASDSTSGAALEQLSGHALVDRVVTHLPDASRFLGRYLKTAVSIQLVETRLEIGWPPAGGRLARRMIEKSPNRLSLEQALADWTGRSITVHNFEMDSEPAQPAQSESEPTPEPPHTNPRTTPGPEPAPHAFQDASPEAPPPRQTHSGPESTHDTTEVPPFDSLQQAAPPPEWHRSGTSRPSKQASSATAAEKARAFIQQDAQAARRAKLLQEMFNGKLISGSGDPISI